MSEVKEFFLTNVENVGDPMDLSLGELVRSTVKLSVMESTLLAQAITTGSPQNREIYEATTKKLEDLYSELDRREQLYQCQEPMPDSSRLYGDNNS